MCENFSKIGPIIKKIPNFVNDPLKHGKFSSKELNSAASKDRILIITEQMKIFNTL